MANIVPLKGIKMTDGQLSPNLFKVSNIGQA